MFSAFSGVVGLNVFGCKENTLTINLRNFFYTYRSFVSLRYTVKVLVAQ